MANLNKINNKVGVYLEDVHFDFEGEEGNDSSYPHIAYTSGDGACSLMNEAFLLKSKEGFSEEEAKLLAELGIEPSGDSSRCTKGRAGEELEETKMEKDSDMSPEQEQLMRSLKEENEALRKQLQTGEIKEQVAKFGVVSDKEEALIRALVEINTEQKCAIIAVMEDLLSSKEEAIKKALPTEENLLAKQLENEVGDAGAPVKKSFAEQVAQSREAQKKQ